jgi:hypothetical protein
MKSTRPRSRARILWQSHESLGSIDSLTYNGACALPRDKQFIVFHSLWISLVALDIPFPPVSAHVCSLIEASPDQYTLTSGFSPHGRQSSIHSATPTNIAGQIGSIPGSLITLGALSPFSPLVRFLKCSRSTCPAAQTVMSEILPELDWADGVDRIRQLF